MNTIIGCKYYKYYEKENGEFELELLRLKRVKNQDSYILIDPKGNEKRLNGEEFKTYTKLYPDGFVTFSIAHLQSGIEDVIITMHRYDDIRQTFIDPYCTCRQNIFNIFANQIVREDGKKVIGCCMSIDTCPKDVNYKIMTSCNGIRQSDMVCIYIDDTLDEILKFINQLNFNDILLRFYNKMHDGTTIGACKSLKELLEYNDFWGDVQKGFDITKVPFVIEPNNWDLSQKMILEGIFKHVINYEILIEYDKDIDLKNVERDYVLLSDQSNKLYVLTYVKGEYINRDYNSLEDQSEKEVLSNIHNHNI